jgi:peptidoglycan/xylan/chitin deacetylase (PgdA/CDA1 family)
MSFSEPTRAPTQDDSDSRLWNAPLAPTRSPAVRARSRALRATAARVLPPSMFFCHGARRGPRKRVALTFDDGPDPMTTRYLEVLEALGVRATFFLIGEHVARRPGILHEYLRRGHEVGGHGWSHEPFPQMSHRRLAEELTRTAAILPTTPDGRGLVRPPRGILSLRAFLATAASGFVTVLWSVDSDDCRTRDPRAIERRLAPSGLASGDVVLFHEMQPWTLQALPGVVHALRDAGYELVTVTELRREAADARP